MKHLEQEKIGRNYKFENLDLFGKSCRMRVIVGNREAIVVSSKL